MPSQGATPGPWRLGLIGAADEALEWADPDAPGQSDLLPRSVNLVCSLCGQPYQQADDACSERELWRSS